GGGPHGDGGAGGSPAAAHRADAGLGDPRRRGASDVVDPLLGIAAASGARHVYSPRCCTNVRGQTYSNLREAEIVVVAWWGCTGGGRSMTHCVFVLFVLLCGMASLKNQPVLPPSADDHAHLRALQELLDGHDDVAVSTSDGSVRLTDSVREVLEDAVSALVRGQTVTVEPERSTLTTQEAARRLGISRPTLVRLLEQGKIPYTKPGRHRRVELADVLAF